MITRRLNYCLVLIKFNELLCDVQELVVLDINTPLIHTGVSGSFSFKETCGLWLNFTTVYLVIDSTCLVCSITSVILYNTFHQRNLEIYDY